MPAKEIKELRLSGNLDEALKVAKSELEMDPNNIWPKRNISWVFYEYLKKSNTSEQFEDFYKWLIEIQNLELQSDEKILFEQIYWQIAKMVYNILREDKSINGRIILLFQELKKMNAKTPSPSYSFLFKSLHKAFKDSELYLEVSNWWDFKNFRDEDFEKEILPNGKEQMSIAEQAFIAYSKHLLPKNDINGNQIFNIEQVNIFLPILSDVVEKHPELIYPAYYKAKLLLALGNKENVLSAILPFAKKKRNEFWVWSILAEAFPNDKEKAIACYCMALTRKSPEEMTLNVRYNLAKLLIEIKKFKEAKTEIDEIIKIRLKHNFRISLDILSLQANEWYQLEESNISNTTLYNTYTALAEDILYSDITEEYVVVEFVNKDKKILNFIASEKKYGFFKYERHLSSVEIGEILKVRFQGGSNEGMHQIYSASKVVDNEIKKQFLREVTGQIKISQGKQFGFIEDVYIHPNIISKHKLIDGMRFTGYAIKTFNKEKQQWSWKLI